MTVHYGTISPNLVTDDCIKKMVKSLRHLNPLCTRSSESAVPFPYSWTTRQSRLKMGSPVPRSTVADIFLYNEICTNLRNVRAEHWLAVSLATESSSSAADELLDSPRSSSSNCSSRCSTLSTTPQRALPTIADFFFYNELRSTLGHVHAEHWMTTAASPCIRSRPASQACSIEPQNRRRAASPRLRSALGHVYKENWLATASPPSSRSRPASQASSGEVNKRRSLQDGECDIARLMNEHGDKVGLLFTDAAHELLDSPRSMASNSSRE